MSEYEIWLEQVRKWWSDNGLEDVKEDPPGEAMWDAFEFITDLLEIEDENS